MPYQMSEADEQQQLLEQKPQKSTRIYLLSAFLVTTLILLTSLILISVNVEATFDLQKETKEELANELPRHFVVSTVGSVRDEFSRGTCWDFATMRFLEDKYRVQGYERGFLHEDEYVRFSEQAHGKTIINYCGAHPEMCPDTPGATGDATDGYPSWIYHFNADLKDKLVVDMETCPYTPQAGNDEDCEGYDEFLKSSGIQYTVNNYKALETPAEIKKALLEKNSSFPLVTELISERFYIPCDVARFGYSNTDDCVSEVYLCPEDMEDATHNRYCAIVDMMTTADAEFVSRRGRMGPTIGAHAMLLVGWSDDYVAAGQSRGGFIVENSWGPMLSHTSRYFTMEMSKRYDQYICPNAESPHEWVPIDYEGEDKWKLRSTTILSYTDGVKPAHFHSSYYVTVKQAMQDAGLSKAKFYAIKSIEQSIDRTHRVVMGVADSEEEARAGEFTADIVLPSCPIDILTFFFTPIDLTAEAENSEDECGYYFIPYDFIDAVHEAGGLWNVDIMDVEFSDSSYAKKMKSGFAKDEVEKATLKGEWTEFESFTPWLDDHTRLPRFK